MNNLSIIEKKQEKENKIMLNLLIDWFFYYNRNMPKDQLAIKIL